MNPNLQKLSGKNKLPADDIFKLENVILTPHIGSNTEECMERIAMDVAKDVDLVLSGEDPRHPIRQ